MEQSRWEKRYQSHGNLRSTQQLDVRNHAVGDAIIVADVGPPVNQRATFFVIDKIGIGFGCYGFMPQGASVRFVDGRPQPSTLKDADMAILGPARADGFTSYGCVGENVDRHSKDYRLVFKQGARNFSVMSGTLVHTMPAKAVSAESPLDVAAADGSTYRIHVLENAGGTYITGWVERLRANGTPLQ